MQTTTDNVTIGQIVRLRDSAASAGDLEMVDTCQRALAGDTEALAECVAVIRDYEAQL